MSFILDALRKSEAERQQQNAPGIASIPHGGGTRSGPRWMWFAVLLLLVNLAVLGGVLMKMSDDDTPVSATAAGSAPQEPAAPVSADVPRSAAAVAVPETTRAAPTTGSSNGADAPVASMTPATKASALPNGDTLAAGDPATSDTGRSALAAGNTSVAPAPTGRESAQVIASFNELRASGALNLPDLHLDIHVYSGQPDERFVFVNMAKYRENATLSEGPVVQEITPDGVILDYRGTDFLLPRE